jgi:hypothetical protein
MLGRCRCKASFRPASSARSSGPICSSSFGIEEGGRPVQRHPPGKNGRWCPDAGEINHSPTRLASRGFARTGNVPGGGLRNASGRVSQCKGPSPTSRPVAVPRPIGPIVVLLKTPGMGAIAQVDSAPGPRALSAPAANGTMATQARPILLACIGAEPPPSGKAASSRTGIIPRQRHWTVAPGIIDSRARERVLPAGRCGTVYECCGTPALFAVGSPYHSHMSVLLC